MDWRRRILSSRVRWCQHLRTQTYSQSEKEGWLAEEEGLRDALRRRDRTAFIRMSNPSQLGRYQLGLDEGQTLLCQTKPLASKTEEALLAFP
jgi:hypothetical protein